MIPKTSAPQGHLLSLEPAEDVIKQMKFTIEGLDPDLKVLEGNVTRPAMGHVPKGSEGRMLGDVASTVRSIAECTECTLICGMMMDDMEYPLVI